MAMCCPRARRENPSSPRLLSNPRNRGDGIGYASNLTDFSLRPADERGTGVYLRLHCVRKGCDDRIVEVANRRRCGCDQRHGGRLWIFYIHEDLHLRERQRHQGERGRSRRARFDAEIPDGALDFRMSQRVGFVLRISFLIENQRPVAHRSVLAVATGCAGR
jgi:hypothetical protein